MGLFDTIVGGSSSPVFLSYQKRNKLDLSPLLQYGDYRAKLAKDTLGERPKIEATELKGLSTDVAYFESMQNQGFKEVSEVFKKYGNNYNYAITTPEYKKAVSKIDIPMSDQRRLLEEEKNYETFNTRVDTEKGGDLVYTGNKGFLGALRAYDQKAGKFYTTTDILKKRHTDPNFAYQVNDDLPMTSTLKRGEDVNKELNELFSKAGVTKYGNTDQYVSHTPWGNTFAALLNNKHTTGGGNKEQIDKASAFLQENLSEDAKVGMFNEFLKSYKYMEMFKEKEQSGKLDLEAVTGYFFSNYVPEYIENRSKIYYGSEHDATIGSQIIEKDVPGKVKEDAMKGKMSTHDAYMGGDPSIFKDNAKINMSFGKNPKTDSYDIRTVNFKEGPMNQDDINYWNKDLTSVSDGKIIYTKPANYYGKAGIGGSGVPENLDELSKQGWSIKNVHRDLLRGVAPDKNELLYYDKLDPKKFIQETVGGKQIVYPGKNEKGQGVDQNTFMTITLVSDEPPGDWKQPRQVDGVWKDDEVMFNLWPAEDIYDQFEDPGLVSYVDGKYQMDVRIPYNDAMMYDSGRKNEQNVVTKKLLEEQETIDAQENAGWQ